MSRRPKASVAAEVTIAIRMTDNDRAVLDRLVLLRRDELSGLGADEADVTAASFVRALIRREAKAKGVTVAPAASGSGTPQAAPSPAVDTAPAPMPAPERPTAPDAMGVHAALVAAIGRGVKQSDIAQDAAIDAGHLSRFKSKGTGLSSESIARLSKVLGAVQ